MEEISEFFKSVMSSYGFWGCAVVIIVTIIAQLVKKPLKNIMEKQASKTGTDKKVLTCWLSFLPLAISLIVTFVFYSWRELNWCYSSFSWYKYLSEASVFAGLSTALYELIDAFVKAQISKAITAIGDEYTKEMTASEVLSKYKDIKKATKQAEKEAKVETQKAELESQIKELQDKLQDIDN